MKVIINKAVTHRLGRLVNVLLRDGYFATPDNAYRYVDAIYDFIFSIEKKTFRRTKNGDYYSVYKANQRTSWYIFFNIRKDGYFIKNITNNHSPDYPELIER